jgi:hypothetical protein
VPARAHIPEVHHSFWFAFPVLLFGCSSDVFETQYRDQGSVCLRSTGGETLGITVTFPGCLSSSCDKVLAKSCSAERSGTEIRIHSSADVESRGGSCTADCGIAAARCALAGLEAGQYSVTHGTDTASVTIPTEADVVLGPDSGGSFACNF